LSNKEILEMTSAPSDARSSSYRRAVRDSRNLFAIISFTAGLVVPILLVLCFLVVPQFIIIAGIVVIPISLVAVVGGHVGLAQANHSLHSSQEPSYRGLAIAGLVLGYLEIIGIGCLSIILVVALRNFS
jgi:hypothetical protein